MILQRTMFLDADRIKTLNSDPLEILLYVPGVHFGFPVITGCAFLYKFNSTPFTMAGEINLYYGNDMAAPLLGNGLPTIDLTASQSFPAYVPGFVPKATPPSTGVGASQADIDEFVYLFADTADPADGDGDLMIVVFWAECGIHDWP